MACSAGVDGDAGSAMAAAGGGHTGEVAGAVGDRGGALDRSRTTMRTW